MKTFKFYDHNFNQKVKSLLKHLEVSFEVDENDLILVEDSKEFILNDVVSLVRTLKFSRNSWYILSIPQESEYQDCNDKLFDYLKVNKIKYLKEIDNNEIWISLCDSTNIPDGIYEQEN